MDSRKHLRIPDNFAFIRAEAKRLRAPYPKVEVAPLLDRIEDNAVAVLQE